MLVVESYFSSRSDPVISPNPHRHQVFDLSLEELGHEDTVSGSASPLPNATTRTENVHLAHSLSLGLVVHALVDGYALGVSASNERSPALSLVVFLAIMVHKGCVFI